MKDTCLNVKQIRSVYHAYIVTSFSGRVFPVEQKMKPAECHGVDHVGFYPMEIGVVRGRERRDYMKLVMVWADRFWRSGAQWHNCAKAAAPSKTRRNDNSRSAFNHFRRNEALEVANDNGSLFRVKFDSHALFHGR